MCSVLSATHLSTKVKDPKLHHTTFIIFICRIIGFISCSAFGFVLSLIGTFILFGGTSATNVRLFAVLYVLGNVIGRYFISLAVLILANTSFVSSFMRNWLS